MNGQKASATNVINIGSAKRIMWSITREEEHEPRMSRTHNSNIDKRGGMLHVSVITDCGRGTLFSNLLILVRLKYHVQHNAWRPATRDLPQGQNARQNGTGRKVHDVHKYKTVEASAFRNGK